MTIGTSLCPNCGSQVTQQAGFCPNCGAKLWTSSPTGSRAQPSNYSTITAQQSPVSTGPYKVAIAVLLVIILILGIGYFTGSAHSPLSLGNYRYQLANPPNAQSILPPNTPTPSPGPTIWNSCGAGPCTMQTSGWREGTVPDTYDYFVSFTSNVSITVYFLTLGQFVQFSVCNGDLSCVSGSYAYFAGATSQQNAVFKLAEGCADYVAIYVSSANGVMTPNIKVAQNAAPFPTGYCAQVGSA